MKQKVLVVDDEEGIRVLMTQYLEKEGFDVAQAENGLDAFEKVKTWKPNLIISDIQMPVWTGIRLFENLKLLPPPPTPTLFISGYVGVQDLSITKEENYVGFIEKPFQMKALVQQVKTFLNKKALGSPSSV